MKTLIAGFSCLLMSGATLLQACSCLPSPPPREEFAKAGAVFSGTVEKMERREHEWKVTFRVLQTWKGTNAPALVVYTGSDSAGCGYSFARGQQYLVYAIVGTGARDTHLLTSLCSRTRGLAAAAEDLAFLGAGQKPVKAK